jgi:hypothetical protein
MTLLVGRAVALAIALTAAAATAGDVAWAADVTATSSGITFTAAPGENNYLSFVVANRQTVVTDAGAALDAGSGCTATGDPHVVSCSRPPVQVTVRTGDGADRINGRGVAQLIADAGPGDDVLVGSSHADSLCGGDGSDLVAGGRGDDFLCGDLDEDQTRPATAVGNDTVDGGPGNDIADGGPGADQVLGGPGGDSVDGGLGADHLDGGRGDDLINLAARLTVDGTDRIAGGSGYDVVFYRVGSPIQSTPVGATLDGQANDGRSNDHDDLRAVENVVVARLPGFFSWTSGPMGEFMVSGTARLIAPSRASRAGVDAVLSGDPYEVARQRAGEAAAQVRLLAMRPPAAASARVRAVRSRCRRARRLSTSASPIAPATDRPEPQGGLRVVARASAAINLGTARWVTRDSCAGTRTTVRSGSVAVTDFRRHRTVKVGAGQTYLARRGNR